ncbi:MAG: hypothetical protein OXU20_11040 [Myxococcales bacterium]|nr:hypothetical protein [Myxococcales bacterium]
MTTQHQARARGAPLVGEVGPSARDRVGDRPSVAERVIRLDDNRYVLQEPLQQTGSTAVWCAWDAPLERMVALRVFRCPTDEFLRALARDAHACLPVSDTHVQRIERYGRCAASGLVFVEAELCAEFADGRRRFGKTLAHVRPRSVQEAARWALHVALGVDAAHRQGVFHGGLTSDCVWIRPQTRRAQVAHFGQALWRRADPGASALEFSPYDCVVLEAPGGGEAPIAGAPCYMAPEQARGTPVHDDEGGLDGERRRMLIDVYGVGAVLYEMLEGVPPYLPQGPVDDPVRDVLSQVRAGPPLPLGQRREGAGWAAFRAPEQLQRILARAMARDPSERYPSVSELARDLAAFLDGRPSRSDGLRPALRTRLWLRRRGHAIGLGLSVLVSVAALVAALSLYRQVMEARERLHEMEHVIQAARLQGLAGR